VAAETGVAELRVRRDASVGHPSMHATAEKQGRMARDACCERWRVEERRGALWTTLWSPTCPIFGRLERSDQYLAVKNRVAEAVHF
jgi:hypothetical protein